MNSFEFVISIVMAFFVLGFIAILLIAVPILTYLLYRAVILIRLFEQDLGAALKASVDADNAMQALLDMPMFFESEEHKIKAEEALKGIRLMQLSVQHIVDRFTERSKQKYIFYSDEEEKE